jgi:hypothetical protein
MKSQVLSIAFAGLILAFMPYGVTWAGAQPDNATAAQAIGDLAAKIRAEPDSNVKADLALELAGQHEV